MNLSSWLRYIESLHPREMELGLDRVSAVARRLALDFSQSKVVTVAGTNGKGSCVTLLEQLALAQGLKAASYTSPHIHRYNERIRVNGLEVDDRSLCEAFQQVENARENTRLTYFEFGTLAALLLFQKASPDLMILEVGLGGRLDAVNIVDCDVAVVVSIDLDHMAWLGDSRDQIAREKIGIMRPGKPLVCADRDPPDAILNGTRDAGVPLFLIGRDFDQSMSDQGSWSWRGLGSDLQPCNLDGMQPPVLHHDIAAAALQVLSLLDLMPTRQILRESLGRIVLAGRFEQRIDSVRGVKLVFDVAHNPAAGRLLAQRLRGLKQDGKEAARIILVLAMMADKDVVGFAQALDSVVDIWYIAQVDQERCMPASMLASRVKDSVNPESLRVFGSAADAYLAASELAGPADTIVITGSFFTVAEVRQKLEK